MAMFNAGHRGRVFYSYLLSFLAILLVPVIISFFVFKQAESVVSTEADRANSAVQSQVSKYLDLVMENSAQLNHLVAYNKRLEALLYDSPPTGGDEYFLAWQLVEDFKTYSIMTTGAVNFYVYIRGIDMVVSPEGYYSTRNYDIARRQFDAESYESWLANLTSISQFTYRPGRVAMVPMFGEAWVSSLELVTPLPPGQRGGAPRGWLVVQVNDEPFRHPFEGTAWAQRSIFLVHHSGGDLLSSSDPRITPGFLQEAGIEVDTLRDETELDLFGDRYVAISTQSSVASWTYTSLVPADVYRSQFDKLRNFTGLALLLCALLGGGLIYAITLARYRPIHDLLATVKPGEDGNISLRSDEFEIIRSSFEATLAEDRVLRQQVSESRPLMLQRLLQQLLRGSLRIDREMMKRLDALGVETERRWCCFVLLKCDDDRVSTLQAIPAYLSSIGRRRAFAVHDVRETDGAIGLLILLDDPGASSLIETLKTTKREIERHLSCTSAMGVSSVHQLSEGLEEAYKEARKALEYRLVRGGAAPICFSEVLSSGAPYHYPLETENKLINAISLGNFDDAQKTLSSVFEANFAEVRLSVEMARCLMFDLISTMIKTLNRLSETGSEARFLTEMEPIRRLTACHSLEELQKEIESMLMGVCARVRSSRSSHTEQLRNEALHFIESHLHAKNLGPEMVAAALHKNTAYIARFFREEMGIGMSSHIKELRVNEAKPLLQNQDLTIREIAEAIGFCDSNALIRAFKLSEGVTPGEFRNALCQYHSDPAIEPIELRDSRR